MSLPRPHAALAALLLLASLPALASGRRPRPPMAPGQGMAVGDRRAKLRAELEARRAARTGPDAPRSAALAPAEAQPGPGAASVSKIVGGHAICPGADLRRADFRRADLTGCDLRNADLRGADLRGARLAGARFEGARLAGARLFGAHAVGAVGLSLAEVRLHPFFQPRPGEPVGALAFLDTEDWTGGSGACPRSLVCGPGGTLFWLAGEGNLIHSLTPTGCEARIQAMDNARLHTLARDALHRVWSIGDRTLGTLELPDPGQPDAHLRWVYRHGRNRFDLAPTSTAAMPDGGLVLASTSMLARAQRSGAGTRTDLMGLPSLADLSPRFRVATDGEGTTLFQ